MPSFDGTNLIITLDSGVTEVDVEVDLYSDWKEFFKTSDNSKFPLAFRTIGGDPLTPGSDAGAYFFIQNNLGWRIRPPEENTTILLTGNLAPEDSTLPILIPTIGSFQVLIAGLQPITQNIDTIKTTLEFSTYNGGVYIDVTSGISGTDGVKGNEANPVDNLTDAQTIAVTRGFTKLYIIGDFTIPASANIDGYTIEGESPIKTTITVPGMASTEETEFRNCIVTGDVSGGTSYFFVHIKELVGICGNLSQSVLHDCFFETGTIKISSGASKQVTLFDCSSVPEATSPPIFDVNGATPDIVFRNFSGSLDIRNITIAAQKVDMVLHGGVITLDSSCTAGTFIIKGFGELINNSAGTTVDSSGLVASEVWADPLALTVPKFMGLK